MKFSVMLFKIGIPVFIQLQKSEAEMNKTPTITKPLHTHT